MNDEQFKTHVVETLARLDAHMETLIGNGQPGRIGKLEDDVDSLKKWFYIGMGAVLAVSAIVHFVFKY